VPQVFEQQAFEPMVFAPQALEMAAFAPQVFEQQVLAPQVDWQRADWPAAFEQQAAAPQALEMAAFAPQVFEQQALAPQVDSPEFCLCRMERRKARHLNPESVSPYWEAYPAAARFPDLPWGQSPAQAIPASSNAARVYCNFR